MILNALIEKDSKYIDLRLRSTTFNPDKKSVEYRFSFPYPLNDEDKRVIYETAKFLTPDGLDVFCHFENDDYSEHQVIDAVKKILFENAPALRYRDDIKVNASKKSERFFQTVIEADELSVGVIQKMSLFEKIKAFFDKNTVSAIELNIQPYKKKVDEETLEKKLELAKEIALQTQNAKEKKYFETFDHYPLIGKQVTGLARCISDITIPSKLCTVCGKVTYIKSYPTKKPDLYVCKLRLDDTTDKIDVTFFANSQAYRKFMVISEGDELIVRGSSYIDDYSGSGAIRAYALTKCRINYNRTLMTYRREAPPFYIIVHPKPYVSNEQISLFENTTVAPFLMQNEITVFDLETTGLDPEKDKIIEIGAVRLSKGRIKETFSCFVYPECEISKRITELTGITNEMLKGQPRFGEVAGDFYKFCENSVLVAHNIQFDLGFLTNASKPMGYIYENKTYDTIELAQRFFEKKGKGEKVSNYKLGTIATALGIEYDVRHRALEDAIATAKVLVRLLGKSQNLI